MLIVMMLIMGMKIMTIGVSHDVSDDNDDDCVVSLCVWGKPNANIVEVGTTTSLACTGHSDHHDDDHVMGRKLHTG